MAGKYPSISSDRNEFRLLKIHPRSFAASKHSSSSFEVPQIHCDLFVASRDNPPEYLALSYTWGDPTVTVPIQVNGNVHRVGRNLRHALEHIQQVDEDLVIWVDAVCINQENHEEKSEQVKHMRSIYASAKYTVVWLGLPEDGSDDFIRRCNEIGSVLAKPAKINMEEITSLSDLLAQSIDLPTETAAEIEKLNDLQRRIDIRLAEFIEEERKDFPKFLSFLATFRSLLTRDYWNRVWIHQEFIVSNDLIIKCGHSKIQVFNLRAALNYIFLMTRKIHGIIQEQVTKLTEHGPMNIRLKISKWELDDYPEDNNDPDLREYKVLWQHHILLSEFQNPPTAIFGMRRRYQELRAEDPLSLIRTLATVFVERNAEATNAKDRIFAMLGLAADNEVLGLEPNYDQSVSHLAVYTEAARAIIGGGHVDLLSLSQHQSDSLNPNEGGTKLPSWVPDWGGKIVRPSGGLLWDTAFTASGDRPFRKSVDWNTSFPEQIKLLGWVIDTLEEVLPTWINPNATIYKDKDAINVFWKDVTEVCNKSNHKMNSTGRDIYSCAYDRDSAYLRIPIADQELNSMGYVRRAGRISEEVRGSLVSPEGNVLLDRAYYWQGMKDQGYRRPFLSIWGYVGLAPNTAEQGDVLVIFCGAKFPYVLRRNDDWTYQLVGEAYVHGVMYGEFVENLREVEEFVLR